MTVNVTSPLDSGWRRNDGECDRAAWIPAGAGMTVGGDGMMVNMVVCPRRPAIGYRGCGGVL